ncbi:MAG: DUF1134 domain-containing protein, partial [Hyphomicrobiales bacterium]
AQTSTAAPPPLPPLTQNQNTTFNTGEILSAGHGFFGRASTELASVVEFIFSRYGEPTAYIVGEGASGAFFGGLRYGEGDIFMRSGDTLPVFWQGPSIGFDMGVDGSRTMVLVYNLPAPTMIYDNFTSTGGLAYVAGGLGVDFQTNKRDVILAVIRSGVGLRLGINVGYLKYTAEPTWNPF